MASTTQNYFVKRVPNTYYSVRKTEKFFSSKIKYDHCWYINGQWLGLGLHDHKKEEFNKNFVDFLNKEINNDIVEIKRVLSTPQMLEYLDLMYNLYPFYCSYGCLGFQVERSFYFKKFQDKFVESVSLHMNDNFIAIIPKDAATIFNRYHIPISQQEMSCLIDFVRLSYLKKFTESKTFCFNNNLNVLDTINL